MSDLEEFQAQTKEWLAQNCPPAMRKPLRSEADACWGGKDFEFTCPDQKLWLERMGAKGWTAPQWPREYGGGGLSHEEAKILKQEMAAINARSPLLSFGIWMLGPALLKYGSEEQKLHYLPPIVRGEVRWCQGYSEPNAGSDLASLQTRCEDKGEYFEVTGQKVWTSYADKSDWIFCLVRTDRDAPKHNGISFILFDMHSEGVSTKPITLISGKSPFCETFFDSVKVPKENLVGTLNKGWDIAKYLLTHERAMIGDAGGGLFGNRSIGQLAVDSLGTDAQGRLNDSALRADLAGAEIDGWAFLLTMERMKDEAKAGPKTAQGMGARSSMLKYYGTELNKRRYELMMASKGMGALEWEGEASQDGELPRAWLRTKANSIEGGTSEVQLNIISKRILGLPGA